MKRAATHPGRHRSGTLRPPLLFGFFLPLQYQAAYRISATQRGPIHPFPVQYEKILGLSPLGPY
jgi:hypothetical protein